MRYQIKNSCRDETRAGVDTPSEELWIRAAQRDLRKAENYQQLVSKFGLQELALKIFNSSG